MTEPASVTWSAGKRIWADHANGRVYVREEHDVETAREQYVRGEIDEDELERRLEIALDGGATEWRRAGEAGLDDAH